jgi:adenosine/AMP kinase
VVGNNILVILSKNTFPINVLTRLKGVPEIVTIYSTTGFKPKGIKKAIRT